MSNVISTDDALRERQSLLQLLTQLQDQFSRANMRIVYLNGVLEGRGVPLDTPVPEEAPETPALAEPEAPAQDAPPPAE